MVRKVMTHITYPVLIAGLVLCLVGVAYAANIHSENKWAWGTNVGWINFNPSHGGGVTVYSDHLEGYVWAENIGWIRLGTHTGGSPHTYGNTTKDNYGVNNDGVGNLSGYAWGTNVGWINFDPNDSQVTIDGDGKFNGYAWGENVGWIHFQNASPEYYVKTDWSPTFTATWTPTLVRTDTATPTSTATSTQTATSTPTPTNTPTYTPTATNTPTPTATEVPFYGVSINDGALYCNSVEVTLTLFAPGNTTEMMISNDGGFPGAEWVPFTSPISWTITSYGPYAIPRIVYVLYKDNQGGVHGPYTDDIILDVTAPSSSVTDLSRAEASSSARLSALLDSTVPLTVAWEGDDDVSGVKWYDVQYKQGSAGTWTDWLTGTAQTSATFDATPGYAYYFQSRAEDHAGNWEEYPGGEGDAHLCVLLCDFDGSEEIDVADIQQVASRWRMTDNDPGWEPRYDLDEDGFITVVDIMMVAAHWGEGCG